MKPGTDPIRWPCDVRRTSVNKGGAFILEPLI